MSTEQEPPHISKQQALKLAGWKPVKNQTRNDLLVYGGWLTSRWEWSRDVDVSLDTAIANSRRLGEDVRIVGNPTPAERRKARGRKPLGLTPEPPEIKVPKVAPLAPLELAAPVIPVPPVKDDSEPHEVQPPEASADGSVEAEVPVSPPPRTPLAPMELPQGTRKAIPAPDPVQASSLLLQRFLIAASLCSVALFLGYYKLAGTLFVSILLLADAFFILTTSLIALKHRRTLAARRKAAPVTVAGAQQGNPQPVG